MTAVPSGGDVTARLAAIEAAPYAPEALRERVIEALAWHRESSDVVPGSGLRVTCSCGWTGGCYLRGYGDPAAHGEWYEHRADAVLAVVYGADGGAE